MFLKDLSEKIKNKGNFSDFCSIEKKDNPSRKSNYRVFVLILLFIIVWSIILSYHPPEEIVASLGVHNIYLFVFLMAIIGGVSAFTSTTFYTTIITISAGGISSVYLGLFASIGLTFGDLVFYYLGKKGKKCIPAKYDTNIGRLTKRIEKMSYKVTAVFIFLYSLTPLPSDILAIALALVGYPWKKLILPLLLGNFALIVILAEASKFGFSLF